MNQESRGPSEVPAHASGELFEQEGLRQRTDFQSRAPRSGADFKAMALSRVRAAGATLDRADFEIDGFPVDAEVTGPNGRTFLVLARGTPDEGPQSGIRRTDTIEKAGFRAIQLARRQRAPILIVTSDMPPRTVKAGIYLASLTDDVFDVVSYRGDFRGFQRLQRHFSGATDAPPPAAPWRMPLGRSQDPLFELRDELEATSQDLGGSSTAVSHDDSTP